MQCATHPAVETELGCSRCGKAICPRCSVQTPVGARCRECANVRRLPTYNTSASTLARGMGGALAAGVVVAVVWAFFNYVTGIFYGIPAGLGFGYVVGEAVSLSANRRSGPPLQAIAVGGMLLAYAVRTGLLFVIDNWTFEDLRLDGIGFIILVIGALLAAGRVR